MPFPDQVAEGGTWGRAGLSEGGVETPWGHSATLRERRLRPGPGTPAEDVVRNQRGRLFAAMVASVAERGYAATRLSDLVELSGVARKSFYGLFADKEQCFVEAVKVLLAAAIRTTTRPTGSWEEQVRGSAAAFAELIVAHPAAARVCLTETYVVGQAALTPVEEAVARFEAHALAGAQEAGLEGEDLAAMVGAHVGALMEIARERLHLGREAELPKLSDDFADLALQSRPPPQPLRLTSRPPTPAPETLDAHGHVERVLRAFAAVVAERGYAATTIELVLKRASMSPKTFYAHFAGKEEVLFAALESAGLQLLAAILPPFHRNPIWTHGVRAAFGDFFNFLASRPALARLLLAEVYAAGPEALERRREALRPLELLLAEGRTRSAGLPPVGMEVLTGGVYQLAYRQIRRAGTDSLPELAPLCTYLALAPLVGVEEACAVANGDGSGRRVSAEGNDGELVSRTPSKSTTQRVMAEIEQAIELGTFDARVERHLSRVPMVVDERGWRELMEIHLHAFHASIAVQAESAERLQRSESRGISGSSVQALFEVPKPP